MSRLTDWAAQITGRWVDRDAAPAHHVWQCHDVWLDYLYDVTGGKPGDGHAPGPEGYTYEVWAQFPYHRPALARLFTKHYGSAGIRPGDVVFWPPGSTNHPWSHVVVALSPVGPGGTIRCVSQNPGPAVITYLSTHQAAGYLRPIINPSEEPMTEAEMKRVAQMTAAAILDAPVKRAGKDRDGKPRTGTTSLRKMLASDEAQIGYTRRIVERIDDKLTGK